MASGVVSGGGRSRYWTACDSLVTDRDAQGRETIEVAHEALLRTWPQLGAWLAEDRDACRKAFNAPPRNGIRAPGATISWSTTMAA